MTKDNGGWSPLMFASRRGNRFVFFAAMQAFIDRGEEGSRLVSWMRGGGVRGGCGVCTLLMFYRRSHRYTCLLHAVE